MDTTFWIKAFELIVSLSLLVFVHELGHYMWARFFKVKVEKFYLFFNPWFTLASWLPRQKRVKFLYANPKEENNDNNDKKEDRQAAEATDARNADKSTWRDTEYGIGWVPLGGYCAIAGMIDETQDASKLSEEPQPWEFRTKPTWQRLLIMVGGVLNNFLFAILIYAGMVYYWGEEYLPYQNAKMGMEFSETAKKAGFVDGDIPLTADGKQLVALNGDEMQQIITAKQVVVLRDGQKVTIAIPEKFIFDISADAENGLPFIGYRMPVVIDKVQPAEGADKAGLQPGDSITTVDGAQAASYSAFTQALQQAKGKTASIGFVRGGKAMEAPVQVSDAGKVGIQLKPITQIYRTQTHSYGLLQSVPRGIEMGWTQLVNYVKQFKYVFTKEGAQSLGGFGAIGSIFPDTWNWYAFWNITALISVILAFMNILPIPALDGGHVLFLLYEIIFRRKPSDKFLEKAQMVGMTLLFALLIYANGNDIWRWIIKPFINQ